MKQLLQRTSGKPHGIRAVGIILHDEQVLVMKRDHDQHHYYTLPGGGVEVHETIEEAVIREIKEETSLDVEVIRLVYHHDLLEDSDQYFYACRYLSGTPTLGGEEYEETRRGNIHEPLWLPLSALPATILYPLEVRDWLYEDSRTGFPRTPRVLRIPPSQLRTA